MIDNDRRVVSVIAIILFLVLLVLGVIDHGNEALKVATHPVDATLRDWRGLVSIVGPALLCVYFAVRAHRELRRSVQPPPDS